jgi:glycosyltransferase involved in cell wall biosynthesis
MRILIALTYYQPYISGLTIYAVRLARALAKRGHAVTVLTSQYDARLALEEVMDGVKVVRVPVLLRLSKAVVMPAFGFRAWSLMRQVDVVNLHVPQMDAAMLAVISRLAHKPIVMTYQCDLHLPSGFINQVANRVSTVANQITGNLSGRIVALAKDYADHSPFFQRYPGKVQVVNAPVDLPAVSESAVNNFREKYQIRAGEKIVGMVARLAAEKGAEYLIEAMPGVLKKYPDARVLYVGPYQNVLGEESYARRLMPGIKALGSHWSFLGVVSNEELAAFYHVCDLTVLPSVNSTDAFGMVQIESILCATPVVASDLPGIRQPVLSTGLGKIVPPRDATALAGAIISLLDHPERSFDIANQAAITYAPQAAAQRYETIFQELLDAR